MPLIVTINTVQKMEFLTIGNVAERWVVYG